MQAVQDFVNAENWDATRHIVETRRAVLFQPEVEILFEQNGRTKHCGARTETGVTIPRGSEVVVTRYERGIAFVKPWGFELSAIQVPATGITTSART